MASSSHGKTDINFIDSKRGNKKLAHAGHQYCFSVKNKDGTSNWRCINRKVCNGMKNITNI